MIFLKIFRMPFSEKTSEGLLVQSMLNVLLVDWMLKKVYGYKYLTTHHALYVLVLSCMIFANCERKSF